jgi:hypothetical protein
MHYELSKPQKKIARSIIEKGLMKDYAKGLKEVEAILNRWSQDKIDSREAYMEVYKQVKSYDRFIGRRYNNMKGSTYLSIIAQQLADELITMEDLEKLDEKFVAVILFLSGKYAD